MVNAKQDEEEEEELFGIVSKLEQSPCKKYHRYHVIFDAKQTPLSMSSLVSLETKLEVLKTATTKRKKKKKQCESNSASPRNIGPNATSC